MPSVLQLFTVQEGHPRPTIEDEAADITVYVRVLAMKDPTGALAQLCQVCDRHLMRAISIQPLLHEFPPPISILYQFFPQSK
jgi:hypothetical protein